MKHYIIVKWNRGVDKKTARADAYNLYKNATEQDGVFGVKFKQNITDRENRYDLMIVLDTDSDNLSKWNGCEIHKKWKADFGDKIAAKCIFDSES